MKLFINNIFTLLQFIFINTRKYIAPSKILKFIIIFHATHQHIILIPPLILNSHIRFINVHPVTMSYIVLIPTDPDLIKFTIVDDAESILFAVGRDVSFYYLATLID